MKLCDLYDSLSPEQRESLARAAETDPGYLWQIATKWRGKKASLAMMQKLVAADSRLRLQDLIDEFTDAAKVA
jgi:hypothetical protein